MKMLKSKIFEGISELQYKTLNHCLEIHEREFKKGEIIFHQGTEIQYFGLLIEGAVQVENTDYFGNRTIIAKIKELDTFAESFLFSDSRVIPFDVTAVKDSKICLISISSLNRCGKNCGFHNTLIANILKVASRKNIYLNQRIQCLTKKTTREKLLYLILSNCTKNSCNSIELPFNREMLADYLAVNRSALSREIAKLMEEGIISVNKNRFTILDSKKLENIF